MLFSSLEFLFFFFPIVILVNFVLPKKARNYWLLAVSLFFYCWGEPTYFLLFLISILVNYCLGLLIFAVRKSEKALEKVLFIFALLLNFGLLFVTKYMNFLTENIRIWIPAWRGMIPVTSFVMPLAVSFYTFQNVGYIIDVHRGMDAEKNPCNYALFIAFFPQLLQGPILRYNAFCPYLNGRKVTADDFSEGVLRFLTGFNQKVLLANVLSEVAEAAFQAQDLSVGMAWLGLFAYSLQLYFDFSGYSDMALGLGRMFGFRFAENFDFPYASKSITEFWRRWHITMGAWFRDYLYFPLGGSRVKSAFRLVLNLLIVWIATGIWHGAEWTFILWGLLHGLFIVFEKLTDLPKRLAEKRTQQFLYRGVVLLAVMFGWVFFRSANIAQAFFYAKSLFKLAGNPWRDSLFKFNSVEYWMTYLFAVLCAFPFCRILRKRIAECGESAASAARVIWYLIQLILAVVSVSSLVMSTHNPFLYADF